MNDIYVCERTLRFCGSIINQSKWSSGLSYIGSQFWNKTDLEFSVGSFWTNEHTDWKKKNKKLPRCNFWFLPVNSEQLQHADVIEKSGEWETKWEDEAVKKTQEKVFYFSSNKRRKVIQDELFVNG